MQTPEKKISIELTPVDAMSIIAISDVLFEKFQIRNKDITEVFNIFKQELMMKITDEDLDDVEAHFMTKEFLKSINL
jgi:hypothetical protein